MARQSGINFVRDGGGGGSGYRTWWQDHPMALVFLRAVRRHLVTGDNVEDGLGDIGGMVADALDILGAEQQMRAGGDVARILHHVSEQRTKQRSIHGVYLIVAVADESEPFHRAGGISVEHF